ncbi:MAG: stage III sporulation protein AB [Oscillospiraceae bacterium]|nr:stage III sporulation protein AB [Oscillospiraceae bacterium]
MNVFLSAITVLFGTAAGIWFSKRLKERERFISSVILLINELTVQIKYTNTEIGAMLKTASQNEAYQALLFVTSCADISENGDFHPLWNDGVKKQPYLTPADRELLFALGDRLGATDLDGQLSFLELTCEMLKKQQQEASENYRKKGRMYRSVGLLCGLAAGIMVL